MNTTTPLGAVVVGTGFGLFTHVRALRDAGFEVRAIIGRDLDKTQKRAAPLGIPLASNDLAQVLADDPAIQLVTVATPPHAIIRPLCRRLPRVVPLCARNPSQRTWRKRAKCWKLQRKRASSMR